MLSALVSRTKALVGLNNNLQEPTDDRSNLFIPHLGVSSMANNNDENSAIIQGNIFDCIRTIRDPEKPATLEDLEVVYESGVKVTSVGVNRSYVVDIEFNPTVPHCSLATLIGLCMRVKVERCLLEKIKLDIHIKKGAHDTEEERYTETLKLFVSTKDVIVAIWLKPVNKQINDKERVAAAMENPSLREMVEKCIKEEDS